MAALHRSRRSIRWLAWAGALSVALTLSTYAVALAHAMLLSSEPAAGSHLPASPARLRLLFSEQVDATLGSLSIVDGSGHTDSLAVSNDPHDVHALIAPVKALRSGEYRVVWHIVSADGHPVGGSFLFSVGAGGAAPPEPTIPPPPATWGPTISGAPLIPALLRGVGVGCLMAAAGLLLFVVWAKAGVQARPSIVARNLLIVGAFVLAAHCIAWLLNASPDHRLGDGWLGVALASTVGRMELWRALLVLPPLWALALARRPALALTLCLPGLVLSSAIGHSAAIHPLVAVPFKAVHLLAIAAWLGGLLWLITAGPRATEQSHRDTIRVSSVALAAAILVTVSGVVQTLLLVSLHDLWSAYGAIVGAKVAGLGILLAFGAHHRYRVIPRLVTAEESSRTGAAFHKTLIREVAVMSLVVLLGGLLAYVSPPADAGGSPSPATPESSQ
jgi:copper transport protein